MAYFHTVACLKMSAVLTAVKVWGLLVVQTLMATMLVNKQNKQRKPERHQ